MRACACAAVLIAACGGQPTAAGQPPALTISPADVELEPGATQKFSANRPVAWPLAEGTWHLVASSVADPSRTATATVTVSGALLAVDPPSATLAAGDRLSFRSRPGVAWSVEEGEAGGGITQGGAYLAPIDHGGTF